MTYEQFYYWLQGYLDQNFTKIDANFLQEKMKEVKGPITWTYSPFVGTDTNQQQLDPIVNPSVTY